MFAEYKTGLRALTKLAPVACAAATLGLVSAWVASADFLSNRSPEQVFSKGRLFNLVSPQGQDEL